MQSISLDYPADEPVNTRTLAGVVGSGDLEVMITPGAPGRTRVDITTSVDGAEALWQAVMDEVLGVGDSPGAMQIVIHDFGATPGVVKLRLAQALEQLETAVTVAASGAGREDNA